MGGQGKRESRYRRLFRLCEAKRQMFLLTATPINNSLRDFQHVIELFSRNEANYFAKSLGIHSLPAQFLSDLEKRLEREVRGLTLSQAKEEEAVDVSEVEAEVVLRDDRIFRALVVQRSRTYARDSQEQEADASGETGDKTKIFPDREPPKVADYSIKKTYGRLLQTVKEAFNKKNPLFELAIYYPLADARDAEKARLITQDKRVENQQQQVVGLIRTNFLKRFESSTRAFEISCARLLLKLLDWVENYAQEDGEVRWVEKWKARNAAVLDHVGHVVPGAFVKKDDKKDEDEDDANPDLQNPVLLSRDDYKINEILLACLVTWIRSPTFSRNCPASSRSMTTSCKNSRSCCKKILKIARC